MNHEDAEAITIKLVDAGYDVDVTKHLDRPEEVAYELSAKRVIAGESWMCLHLRDRGDVEAITTLFTLAEQEDVGTDDLFSSEGQEEA